MLLLQLLLLLQLNLYLNLYVSKTFQISFFSCIFSSKFFILNFFVILFFLKVIDQTSLDFEKLGMEGASHGSEIKKVQKITELRERQPRLRFSAGQPSPVCSMIVQTAKVGGILSRSQTIANCSVGEYFKRKRESGASRI